MTTLLTAAQMRAIEQAAIDSGEVTGLELMERAGRGVVEAILDWHPDLSQKPHRAVVLCGPGNNGGDGFVTARLLHARGWKVDVFLYGCDAHDLSRLPADAQTNARRWSTLGSIGDFSAVEPHGLRNAVLIDALFGSGLSRPLDALALERLEEAVGGCSDLAAPPGVTRLSIALDAPSGLCLDSGKWLGGSPTDRGLSDTITFDLTVSFHALKRGHVLAEGPLACGRVSPISIGLDSRLGLARIGLLRDGRVPSARVDPGARCRSISRVLLTDGEIGRLPHRKDTGSAHKYSHGHALVLTGGVGKGGAARLAARGALRVGAGLATVGCPKAAVIENAARLDAIMLRPLEDAEALAEALSDVRINALCLGPGLGLARAREMVPAASAAGRAVVLDADALTAFAEDPSALWALTHPKCVLTPHEGEFGRLFPDILAKLREPELRGPAYSKVDATREAAARAGCVVLFKGPDTVIADPSGQAAVNAAVYERAAPWLATAGSGDVLAGMVTGLLARGFAPMAAAETAAWLHVEAARRFGPGLIAEDIPDALPGVFRDLDL
ncbi:MAG: NAD(P)H-hydrate dehydratase [Pseudomonadota bacterium]